MGTVMVLPNAIAVPALSRPEIEAITADGIDRYVASRRDRIDAFIDANYSLLGSLALHRRAFGRDLLRAPANAALVLPQAIVLGGAAVLSAVGGSRIARRLRGLNLSFETDVGRELAWRLHTDLLGLPYDDGRRRSLDDALAAAILADARLASLLAETERMRASIGASAERQRQLRDILATYARTRDASAELLTNAVIAGAGGVALQQLTPGALSLGPALAGVLAQQAAIASFPLGVTAGGLWYSLFTATPSTGLVVGATGGVIALAALIAPFAGIVTDPLQRSTGLHRRRLQRLITAVGRTLHGSSDAGFRVRDHYVARIFDIVDLARALSRALGPS